MAASPRMVIADIQIAWDGALVSVPAGTVVDIPPGSALEVVYGLGNLVNLSPQDEASITSGSGSAVSN